MKSCRISIRLILLFSAITLFIIPISGQSVYFDDSKGDTIILGNHSYYEIGIDKFYGGIRYIKNKLTGENVTTGSPYGIMLWGVALNDGSNVWSTSPQNKMSYEWISDSSTLLLKYIPTPDDSVNMTVIVKIDVFNDPWFDMGMSVINNMNTECIRVSFPLELGFSYGKNDEAVLACDYPGMKLNSTFFSEKRSFTDSYPGSFHADFVTLNIKNNNISLYTLRDGLPVNFTWLGLTYNQSSVNDENIYWFRHEYSVWIKDGNSWTTPVTRISLSNSIIESVKDYRLVNKLESFPSIESKTGDQYNTIIRSPYYCHIFGTTTNRKFREMSEIVRKIPPPGIMMLLTYYSGGFDGYHPDYLPPDPNLGTTDDFKAMVKSFHKLGHLVMPFTLPCWWHENSPTVQNLPAPLTINDISQIDETGKPLYRSWELGGKVDWGYFVSPYHPFVKQRIDRLFKEMTEDVPDDIIYADVVGAWAYPYDLNQSSPAPALFNEGWLKLLRNYNNKRIVYESGYDRLAEISVGFMGTVRLHDYMVASGNIDEWYWNRTLGSKNWLPYPIAPFLYNDKTLTYQYWATGSNNRANLGWNLLFGCMLNITDWEHLLETNSYPWFNVISDFQQQVVSRIAGKLMIDYTEFSDKVAQSTFEDITVTRNNDTINSYPYNNYTLPAEGVLVTSFSGDLIAGIFQGFNNETLSTGDHYLIINNDTDSITIRQPLGSDTDLTIDRPDSWTDDSKIKVYNIGRMKVQETPNSVSGNGIHFRWKRYVSPDTARYYIITYNKILGIKDIHVSDLSGIPLFQVYPNPFRQETVIKFELSKNVSVRLTVYNSMGLPVWSQTSQYLPAGKHQITWDGTDNSKNKLPEGIYFIKIQSGEDYSSKKVIIEK